MSQREIKVKTSKQTEAREEASARLEIDLVQIFSCWEIVASVPNLTQH